MRQDDEPVEGWHWIAGEIGKSWRGDDEAIVVGGEFLIEFLEEWNGKRINCCYGFAPSPFTPADMAHAAIEIANGYVDAEFRGVYSEITGFLWLVETGMIGGHDMVKIFYDHEGEYGCLIVSEAPIEISDALK